MKPQKKKIPLYLSVFVIILCIALVAVFTVKMIFTYMNGHEITETDKTANVNVMLTRPENWEKLDTGSLTLTKADFSKIDGSTATIPITAELARQFCNASDEEIRDYIDHNTTHYAYENLINTCSGEKTEKIKYLIFVTPPAEGELEMAQKAGVSLETDPVALDGFVFITHKDNPVDSLTVEQIQGIYSGKITNWKEVGGNDSKIIPYQREMFSGSQTAMEQLVMKDVELMEPANGYRIETGMGELVEKIAEYENRENSIGYTYYYYLNNLYRNENIKVLKVDGISPDNENLKSRKYPFTTAYYAVMGNNCGTTMRELRDFLLSREGQKIIEMAGYCPAGDENG